MEAYALFEHLHLEMISWPTADRDEHITVLEGIGYKVGLALCQRLCKDKPRFKEELDIIKFICQDFWNLCFKKGVNSLKTDNAGTYVIHDSEFRMLTSLANGKQYLNEAPKFLAFPCGLIRGALCSLQVTAHVTVDVAALPNAKFKIDVYRK